MALGGGGIALRFLSKIYIYSDLEIMRISECVFELFFGFLDLKTRGFLLEII